MNDIVERLRAKELLSIEEDGYTHFLPKNPDGDDGADEIIRLRAENETLRRDVKTAVMGDSAELADVKRDNENLRKALKAILNDAGYRNPMRMTTEISDKVLEDAAGALNDNF